MACLLSIAIFLGAAFPLEARPAEEVVVYLDPGHGGQDAGSKGAGGLLEKNVALALAKRIEKNLSPQYVIVLSRNDDYDLDLYHRTETANGRDADLFVSLHVGGAFNYSTGGLSVYYYHDAPGRILPEGSNENLSTNTGRIPWHSVQYRHTIESRILSQFLQASLTAVDETGVCKMTGAPLLVLSAANMPAVLVEAGCMNNPVEEKKLADPDYLNLLADAVSSGIKNYLERSTDITSIDLHE